jgi:L-2,4-diaminobutyrate decarboxylase
MSETEIPYPFDPEKFRSEGHKLVDTLSDYLNYTLNGNEMKVLPWQDPDELADQFSFDSCEGEKESFDSFFRRIIENSIHIHHPHYIGHQVTSPLPATALAQLCTSLLNNGAAIYEMGPVNMAMERNVINKIGSLIGYKSGYDGIFTHGGTAGNLTAMLAARQNITEYNIWEEGVREENKPAYMVSAQAHYSVGRNVRIMGLGGGSAVQVPVDNSFKMRTGLLEDLKDKAEKEGTKIIAVVASACSTATGSYDNLEEIAGFCEKHNLWMHVDGAHGMGVLFSDKYRNLVKGIERADSVVIDFHKMFLVPALNTLVMFKNSHTSYETFAQKASYLFQKTQSNLWYESAIRTIECTKSALGIIAYTALKYYGNNYYREYVDSRYDLARTFAAMIQSDKDFELAVAPESNIVCFRFIGNSLSDETANKFNLDARDRIMKEGSFYIVKAELQGKIWLRVTIINPVTSINALNSLLVKIKETDKQ